MKAFEALKAMLMRKNNRDAEWDSIYRVMADPVTVDLLANLNDDVTVMVVVDGKPYVRELGSDVPFRSIHWDAYDAMRMDEEVVHVSVMPIPEAGRTADQGPYHIGVWYGGIRPESANEGDYTAAVLYTDENGDVAYVHGSSTDPERPDVGLSFGGAAEVLPAGQNRPLSISKHLDDAITLG